ncbi:MAG: right-handed parallel beta-helix repeat-containing protein [Saprospiraceae bacterium]
MKNLIKQIADPMKKNKLSLLSLLLLLQISVNAQAVLRVGPGQIYANPLQAAAVAKPGDTILIYPAIYTGPFFIENLKGTKDKWITLKGLIKEQVIFRGGSESMHFTDPNYLRISDLTIERQTGNGMNIDDGGTFNTVAKQVIVENCTFQDMAASGNNDLLKLSGLDSFTIRECSFINGSAGGSGIDMVGCHAGKINKNTFTNQGSNSIQMKGGSSNLHIEANYFINGGQRALNLGGSTGAAFFRPAGADYEAKDLLVSANIFEGAFTPIAFVGCRNAQVINNTIIRPQNWIMRILQESSDTSFYKSCANNTFSNNIVVVTNSLSTDVNIGPYTSPASFTFSNNLWYHLDRSNWTGPNLPKQETNGIRQQNPLFVDLNNKNYHLQTNSPAIAKGISYPGVLFDYEGKYFKNPPAIGAYETGIIIFNKDLNKLDSIHWAYNSNNRTISIFNIQHVCQLTLFDVNGNSLNQYNNCTNQVTMDVQNLTPGLYFIQLINKTEQKLIKIIIY